MAFQRVPNSAEVTISYLQNGEVLANVFHAELSTGYTLVDIIALAAAVDAAVVTWLRSIMTIDCVYTRTEVRGLDTENDLFASNDLGNGPGADVIVGLPGSVTFSIKKESGRTGRSARGRWYFVGMTKNFLTTNENVVNASDDTAMVNGVEGLRQAVLATAWSPVIVSRYSGGVERAEGLTFPWISCASVNSNVDTQRRRLTT